MPVTQKKILIVDDDDLILKLLYEIFSKNGFKVIKASDAAQALTMFSKDTHIVVTDLDMPGMNGLELASKLKESSDIPVVAVTGMKLLTSGQFNAILHKPVLPKELLKTVKGLLKDRDIGN